jgi:hypothetical protein
MYKVIVIVIVSVISFSCFGCASSPTPRPQPNYDQVRQDHQGAQQELQKEEPN